MEDTFGRRLSRENPDQGHRDIEKKALCHHNRRRPFGGLADAVPKPEATGWVGLGHKMEKPLLIQFETLSLYQNPNGFAIKNAAHTRTPFLGLPGVIPPPPLVFVDWEQLVPLVLSGI